MSESTMVFVNTYKVERAYGGAEEGGWWYDRHSCIESVPCLEKYAELIEEHQEKKYEGEKYGNISSVLGGVDIRVYIESEPCKSETRETPTYE